MQSLLIHSLNFMNQLVARTICIHKTRKWKPGFRGNVYTSSQENKRLPTLLKIFLSTKTLFSWPGLIFMPTVEYHMTKDLSFII